MTCLTIFAAADPFSSPEQAGRLLGQVLGLVLVSAGIAKCVSIMRRATTGRLCVLSLLVVLGAYLVGSAWSLVLDQGWLQEAARPFIMAVTVPSLLLAFILAIVALALYDDQRLRQGRKQAVWALILSTISLIVCITELALASMEGMPPKGFQELAGKPGEEAVRENYNFALAPPGSAWWPIQPKNVSSAATLAFRWQPKEIYAVVVAEESLALMDNGLEPLAENVKINLAKHEVREQKQERVTLGDLEFIHLTSRIWNAKQEKEYSQEHWVATRNGFAWQVILWGEIENKAAVAEQSQAMVRGFRVLDLARITSARERKVDVGRPSKGYSTQLSDLGWRTWTAEESDSNVPPEMADLAVQTLSSCFMVLPHEHRMEGSAPALEALARAYLSSLDFTYRRANSDYTTRTLEKPFPGLEITTEREVDGDAYRYLFRIHQSGRHAWMLGGWTRKGKGGNLDVIRAACDRVTLKEPAAPNLDEAKSSASRLQEEGHFLNQLGIWYHHRDECTDALRFFREASRLFPDDYTYLENVTHALETDGQIPAALELMESARDRSFAAEHGYQARQAWLRIKGDEVKEGAKQVLTLIGDGYKLNDSVLDFINELLRQERYSEAREVADAYAKANPEARARLWQAQVARQGGDPERATALLETLAKEEPEYFAARYSLGEISNSRGKHERALELADSLEKEGQDSARLHLMRGWAHMGRKWYREAKASFEKAAKLEPEDDDVKTALQEASASLGQGSNTEIKTPIEPVPLPPRIASRLDELRAAPEDFGKGHNSAMLLWCRSIRYTPDKPMRTTTRRLIRVLNEEGAGALSTMEFTYDPLIERLHVNHVEVTDASGKVSARAASDDAYVLDSEDRSMATSNRTVHVQVPGLKAGQILDCEVTVERLYACKEFPFQRHLFAGSIPTQLEAVGIAGDIGGISQDLLLPDQVKTTRESDSVVFEVSAVPLAGDEDYAQPVESWAPVLVLSSKGKSWEEIGRNYLKEIAGHLKPDPVIEAEAKRLTEGLKGPREKARALTAFVQKTVRYKAIEFGVRGQIPNPPAQTLQQRYGDCKDQALLLHHLLRASGIVSHLAMVDTEWELDLKQPDLDAFNHVIVHVPDLPMPGFIDTTASHVAAADQTPYGLWGQSALVLDSEKPALMKIPGPAPGSGEVVSKRTLSLLPPNGVRVVEELTLQGYYASGMRGSFSREEPKARFQHAQDLLDDLGSYRLEEFDFINLTDPNLPAILRLTYTLPNAIEQRGGVTKLRLPCAWETDYMRVPFIKERATPFRWRVPFTMHSEVNFDPSISLAPESLAAMEKQRESRFGRWTLKAAGELRFDFTIVPGSYPAADYAEFQGLWSAARDAWEKEVTLAVP